MHACIAFNGTGHAIGGHSSMTRDAMLGSHLRPGGEWRAPTCIYPSTRQGAPFFPPFTLPCTSLEHGNPALPRPRRFIWGYTCRCFFDSLQPPASTCVAWRPCRTLVTVTSPCRRGVGSHRHCLFAASRERYSCKSWSTIRCISRIYGRRNALCVCSTPMSMWL